MTHHMIVLDKASDYRNESYGITFTGRNVHDTTVSHSPTRLVVWDNTGRPNPDLGRDDLTDWQVRQGMQDRLYRDPMNVVTDDEVSLLLSPESSCITSSGTNTGTVASGQVYAPGRLANGDTATLSYPDGTMREVVLCFPSHRNGHGYAMFTG